MNPSAQAQPDPLTLAAFHRALAEHADGLKTFATRLLRDAMAAEDIAQDAFLALYRHLHEVPENAFRPWLYRVARNFCLDQLRRRKFKLRLFRDVAREDEPEPVPVDTRHDRPEDAAHAREVQVRIQAAIEALPVRFREAFLLCEMQGLSYEDAAAILNCPVKTVSTRLFRARQRFKEALGDLIRV
ncbi:MAG: RNA polymerase sigma factor [Planctomycetes bacterium]|nr:RNA polymerase sigma factor [Planctomycetota bacterium]